MLIKLFKKQKVNESEVLKFGFLGGLAEAVYIFLVVSFILFLDQVAKPPAGILGMMLALMLLVVSAAISGICVFGYPAYLALQKRFAEAVMTALTTLAVLIIIGIFVFIIFSTT